MSAGVSGSETVHRSATPRSKGPRPTQTKPARPIMISVATTDRRAQRSQTARRLVKGDTSVVCEASKLPQTFGNAGTKPIDAKCFDKLVTDTMTRSVDRGLNGLDQVIGPGGIDHTAKLTIKQRVARSIDRATNYRNSAGHGLNEHNTETFPMARHYVKVCQVIVRHLFGLGDTARKDDVVCKPMRSSLRFEPGSIGSVSDNQVTQIRKLPQ